MEQTAETNVEEFDETEVDAGLGAATAQETEPEESYEEAPEAAEGETEDEAGGEPRKAPKEPEKPEEKPFVKKGNDSNRDRRIAQKERWKREREEERARAYQKGLVDAVGGVNPYTNSKIEDAADIQEFLAMREIEKGGGDPLHDYPAFVKEQSRKKTREEAEAQQRASKEGWIREDFEVFRQNHADLDVEKLIADEKFLIFSEGKLGSLPMEKIYGDFLKIVGDYQAEAEKKAQRLFAKAKASPGSLAGEGTAKPVSYSAMSDEEFEKVYQKAVRGELKK